MRERNMMCERNNTQLPLSHPPLGTCPTIHPGTCPDWESTGKLSLHRSTLSPLSHTSQGSFPCFKLSGAGIFNTGVSMAPSSSDSLNATPPNPFTHLVFVLCLMLGGNAGDAGANYTVPALDGLCLTPACTMFPTRDKQLQGRQCAAKVFSLPELYF